MGWLTDRLNKKAPTPTITTEVMTGGYGGIPARVFSTLVHPVFTRIPGARAGGGVSTPIADRPNSASMLKTAAYYTQIPGIGVLNGMATKGFKRGTAVAHPAAVTDVTHVRQTVGVHPTVVRQVRRGNSSL